MPFSSVIVDVTPDVKGIATIFDAEWADGEKIVTPQVLPPPPSPKSVLPGVVC